MLPFIVLVVAAAPQSTLNNTLLSGASLYPGCELRSDPGGQYWLVLQADGNLVEVFLVLLTCFRFVGVVVLILNTTPVSIRQYSRMQDGPVFQSGMIPLTF